MPTTRSCIPVILKFSNVASNASVSISFSSKRLRWCLGADVPDSLGFSYNVMNTDQAIDSCIQQIEFNGAILTIRTSASAPNFNDFSLTLYLELEPEVRDLHGYCTLNNEAHILASFGSERQVQWRNGRISAVLRQDADAAYRSVLFAIKSLLPKNTIVLELSSWQQQDVSWSLGENLPGAAGLRMGAANGMLPLSSISYGKHQIALETSAPLPAGVADMTVLAYIHCDPAKAPAPLDSIFLRSSGSANVVVYAQVGNRQPQLVSDTFTVFAL